MENVTVRQALKGDLPDHLVPGFTVVTDLATLKQCHYAETSAAVTILKEIMSGSLEDVSEEELVNVASPFAYIVGQILRVEASQPDADPEAVRQQLHKLSSHSNSLMGFESSVLAATSRYHREESEGLPPSDFVEDTRRLVASLRSELEGFHKGTLGMAGMAGIPRLHTARQTIGKLYSHDVLSRLVPEVQHRMNLGELMSESDHWKLPSDLQDEIRNLHAGLFENLSVDDTSRLLGYAATVACGRGAQGDAAVIDWSTVAQGDVTRDSMARIFHTYKYLEDHGIDMTYEPTIDGSSGRALVANVTEAMRRANNPGPQAFEITQDIVDLLGSGSASVLALRKIDKLPGVSGGVVDVNKVKAEISGLSTALERIGATTILNNLINAERNSRVEMYSGSIALAKAHVFHQKERMFQWIETHEENGDAVREQLTTFLNDCNTTVSKIEALEAVADTSTQSGAPVGSSSNRLTVPPITRQGKRSNRKKNKRKGKSAFNSAATHGENIEDHEDGRSADCSHSEVSENSHSQQDSDLQRVIDVQGKLRGTRYEGLNTLTQFLSSWSQLKNEAVSLRFGDMALEPKLQTEYMAGKYHSYGPSMPVPSAYGTAYGTRS